MKKSTITLSGRTRLFLWWPLILTPFVFILLLVILLGVSNSPVVTIVFACIYVIFAISWIIIYKKKLSKEIVAFAESYNEIQTRQLDGFEVPMAFIEESGYLIWENEAFKKVADDSDEKIKTISEVFPEFEGAIKEGSFTKKYKEHIYRVEIKTLNREDKISCVNLFDITERCRDKKKIEELGPVVIALCVDNLDELMKNADSFKRPIFSALIERKISQYFSEREGVVSNVDKGEYVIFTNNKGLEKIKEDKFSIVEEIRKMSYQTVSGATISIGIGAGSENILINEKNCRAAIDLCLARGGDQIVIKTPNETTYLGGKTEKTESPSKVKMRIFAQDFLQLILTKKNIYIMGHANADADSLGAALGVYKIAKHFGKEAKILFNEPNVYLRALYDMVKQDNPDAFYSNEPTFDEGSMLVVVDVNKPNICEFPNVVKKANTIVVIDHHRKNEDAIKSVPFEYVETFASSTSEAVTEIIQSVMPEDSLDPTCASALYAGIVVDTYNFNTKTGPRTFEAAAFLKKNGADGTKVRKMLREGIDAFKEKINIFNTVEIFENAYAFGVYEGSDESGDPIIGAQAANALLEIDGVKASFVFTPVKGKIYISARSIDETNVQIILEKMGGGGHLTVAGAQLEGYTLEEAKEYTKKIIKEMTTEGEI